MSFAPIFIDLVRNYTTTSGVGNFVLGPAVTGYRSFTVVVKPGESFYYTATGIDHPAEVEVGRGTMQADGSISREPIGGDPTSFKNGFKAVALVAAAEWFQGVKSDSIATAVSADSRPFIAALADHSRPALLHEPGREGLFVFEASDLAAGVASDSGQGLSIAPLSDPSAASGAWVRRFDGPVRAEWFGLKENDGADEIAHSSNLKAINRAIHAAIATGRRHVVIPTGTWYINAVSKSRWTPDAGMEAEAAYSLVVRAGAGNEFTLEFEPGAKLVRTANDGTDLLNGGVAYTATELAEARILIFRVDGGETYRVIGYPHIDGNEDNYPFAGNATIADQFKYQHAHNLMFAFSASAGATAKARLLELRNYRSSGAVGGGATFACLSEQVIVDGVYSDDRTRRYRSDFEVTLLADRAWIDNVVVDAFEYEPIYDNLAAVHWWGPNNIARSVLDILGQASDGNYLTVEGFLPTHTRQAKGSRAGFWLYYLEGDLALRRLTTGGTNVIGSGGENNISRPKLKLRGGTIVIQGQDAAASAASQVTFWTNADGQFLEFEGTHFAVTGVVTGGTYVHGSVSTAGSKALRLIDCETDGALDYVADFTNGQVTGSHVFDGGRLQAKTAIIKPQTGTGSYQFRLGNFDQWRAKALIDGSGFLNSAANTDIYIDGEALLDPAVDSSGVPTEPGFTALISSPSNNYASVNWHVRAVALVASSPAARLTGIPGMVARLRSSSAIAGSEWVYANGAVSLGKAAWQAVPDSYPAQRRSTGRTLLPDRSKARCFRSPVRASATRSRRR